MSRSGASSILLGRSLTLSVAILLMVSAALTSPADEPASRNSDAKPTDPKKIEAAAKHKDAALKVAEVYLVLLDKGKYAESWETHCAELRNGLPRQKWVEALNKTRKPFGRLQRRKLNRIEMRASENPDRIDQAWIYSNLVFQNGWNSGELVTIYFEKNKDWKVSGYFVGDPDTLPKPPEPLKDEKNDEETKESKAANKKAKKKAA